MKSVCIFVHFGHNQQLPYPEVTYVRELDRYFSEIILVTNQRKFDMANLPATVSLKMVENEGYDFGMFFKVARELDWESLDRLALANDSNLMIQSLAKLFERGEKSGTPFWGAIDSHEKPLFSTHADNYHLQSHFLVWEKPVLPLLKRYLAQVPIQDFFGEKNAKNIRRKVINDWEIGVSQYFLKNKIKLGAAFGSEELYATSSKKIEPKANSTIKNPEGLLQVGYPFLKKRVVTKQGFLTRIFFPKKKWESLVRAYSFDAEHAKQIILSIKKNK